MLLTVDRLTLVLNCFKIDPTWSLVTWRFLLASPTTLRIPVGEIFAGRPPRRWFSRWQSSFTLLIMDRTVDFDSFSSLDILLYPFPSLCIAKTIFFSSLMCSSALTWFQIYEKTNYLTKPTVATYGRKTMTVFKKAWNYIIVHEYNPYRLRRVIKILNLN